MKAVLYITETHPNDWERGRILQHGVQSIEQWESTLEPHQSFLAVDNLPTTDDYYVDLSSETVVPKADLSAGWDKTTIVADGSDEAALSTLPIPCEVLVWGSPIEVDDGSFEFATEEAGPYSIIVNHARYKYGRWRVYAV